MHSHFLRSIDGSENTGGVYPRFYVDAIQDELASAREGRPIFKNIEFVEIFMPGNQYNIPVKEVDNSHRARWPKQYQAFKQGLEQSVEGTPLEEWPPLNRAQVLELKAMNILTVEMVANLTDTACQRSMGLMGLRAKAKAFLDDAAAMALVELTTSQIDTLRSENAALREQVKELGEMTQRLHGEVMGMRNATHPLAAVIPASLDPMERIKMQQPGLESRDAPQSSLASFADEKRRPGRPRKNADAAA